MDWHKILFNDQDLSFFLEILLRTPIMFIVALAALRVTGKRSGQQLSIFEVVMIITLGSAAGDAMFYQDVGLLHAVAVFVIVLALYRLLIFIITKNEKAEEMLEGKPIYIIRDGVLCLQATNWDEMGADEFFAELRVLNVSHLGQVKCALLEANGKISLFCYADEEVRPGLPILPDQLADHSQVTRAKGMYACCKCGFTLELAAHQKNICEVCESDRWVPAVNYRRIT